MKLILEEPNMRKIFSLICASTVALTAFATTSAPVVAAPFKPMKVETQSDIQQIQNRRGYYRSGGRHYYNGHRGYRQSRQGWRQHNGWWFPPAAFAAGVIVGGSIAQPAPVYRPRPVYRQPAMSNAHIRWCYDRYRSYRASDNTFQPYNGPRQICYSPYR
jgi:hypothetical protein